jgi:hypothetical protein
MKDVIINHLITLIGILAMLFIIGVAIGMVNTTLSLTLSIGSLMMIFISFIIIVIIGD